MSAELKIADGQDEAAIRSAAADLHAGYLSGTVAMNDTLAGLSLDEGLALQLRVLDSLVASGEELGGWKVGMTSGPSLNRMGEGFRPFGYILKRRIFQSGATVALQPAGPAGIEPELCFRVEKPLSGAVTREAARAAVSGAIPSFELLAFRIQGKETHGATIADDLMQWGLVLGTESTWRGEIGEMEAELHHDGKVVAKVGPRFAIDDPFESIATLCRQLDRFGRGLKPGEHIITGAFHKTALVPGRWTAEFKGGAGAIAATAA